VSFWRKLRALLPGYRAAQEREMQEELESLKAIAGRNELGNLTLVAEDARSAWRWNWLDTLWQDVRYSVRTLRKSPGFTITAVVVLSVGIGLNLTFFQALNVEFLKPLPIRDAKSLVHVTVPAGGNQLNHAAMEWIDASNTVFSGVLQDMRMGAPEHQVMWEDDPVPVKTFFVSPNWFDELGVKPLRGRLFRESTDAGPAANPVAVISERYWETRLDRSPDTIGAKVRLSGKSVTIVGIVPRSMGVLQRNEPGVWLPVEQIPYLYPEVRLRSADKAEQGAWGYLYGRLRPGVSIATATESLRPLLDELARQQPVYARNNSVALFSGASRFRTPRTTTRSLGIVGLAGSFTMLILLIACANLANLVLSRTVSRLQELSVRVSLGASRTRILRHLLTETGLVAVLASCGGLMMAYWGTRIIAVMNPDVAVGDMSLDWRTLAVALAGTIFMTAFVGLLPAWTIGKRDLAIAMKDGAEQTSYSLSKARQRQFLLAAQVTGSCALLVVAGLMLRTLQKEMVPPGFDAENVLAAERLGIEGDTARLYWKNLRDNIAQQPGIESVALSRVRPGERSVAKVGIEGFPGLSFSLARVSPEFFDVMRIPFLTGQPYETSDIEGQAIVLGKNLAMRIFGTVDVVGRVFPNNGRVAGVVDDIRLRRSEEPDQLEAYAPLDKWGQVVVLARARTSADAGKLAFTLPATLRQVDARIPSIALLQKDLDKVVEEAQVASAILSSLGALALAVACMGIFGVVSYSVALRRKEIGIRLALGALDRSIVVLMMRQLIWPVSLAIIAGLIGGVAVGMVFASEGDFAPVEAPVVFAALLVLLAAIGLACIIPTLRALRHADTRVLSS
jgi:predicted permease